MAPLRKQRTQDACPTTITPFDNLNQQACTVTAAILPALLQVRAMRIQLAANARTWCALRERAGAQPCMYCLAVKVLCACNGGNVDALLIKTHHLFITCQPACAVLLRQC